MSSFKPLVFCLLLLFAAPAVPAAENRADEGGEIDLAQFVDTFRRSCVRVYVNGKSHDGQTPAVGDYDADILNERPTPLGGYWWDKRHVVVEDDGIQECFIRSIEIGLPLSDRRYPARLAGRFQRIPALLIEALPDDEGKLPEAVPLAFAEGDPMDGEILSYGWINGMWRVSSPGVLNLPSIADEGIESAEIQGGGVLVGLDGEALGLAFGTTLPLGDRLGDWFGPDVAKTPILRASDAERKNAALGAQLAKSVLEIRFRLRVKIDDEDEQDGVTVTLNEDQTDAAEIRSAGLAVGGGRYLVPLALGAEGIARIEEIGVRMPDGRELDAEFVGASREYLAVMVAVDEETPVERLPAGFALLDPMLVPAEEFQPRTIAPGLSELESFSRWRVDYALGKRREKIDYDRWMGTFRGYRGDPVVLTLTNEEAGSMAFDRTGRLVALALGARVVQAPDDDAHRSLSRAVFHPVDFLGKRIHQSDFFDAALKPVDEDEGRRLIDLGVEYQELDANTSRLFSAERETRGGDIGMLVTYIYPDSPAERLGLREHDVLLRLFFEGKKEPVELRASDDDTSSPLLELADMSADSLQEMLAHMPAPWPSRDNALSSILTSVGVGKQATLEYLREGVRERAEFITSYTEPDFRNAKKHRFPGLGLTVKPITYEVARFYRRPDTAGVIISKIEEGGKSSVAGLHPYLVITHLDGVPVKGVADFQDRIEAMEEGKAASVELTLEGFGKTRLVKIER